MSSVARNRLPSALGLSRRLVAATSHAHLAETSGVRRACSAHQTSRNTACWRTLECNTRMAHSMTQPTWVTNKDESRELMAIWPDIVRDITDMPQYSDVPDVTKWIAKVLQYNIPGGKKTRGLTAVYAYKMLAPSEHITEDNIRLIRILAWCIEMVQGFFLLFDDIMDRSTIRRKQPCWYLHNDLGLAAVNDGLMIENITYQILQKHFKEKECYVNLLETFHDTVMKTTMGQVLDLHSVNFDKTPKYDLFTMDRYNSIVKYKTSYYTFILPVTIAMHFAGIKDQEMFRQARTILFEMGHFYQVQDDYLSCYGDPEIMGKIGTDIEEGKCTWLAVVALQRFTPQQRTIFEKCYASSDPEKVNRVKQLYNDLNLLNTYSIYEEETYNLLNTHIQQISRGLPHKLFLKILEKIYRRVS